MGTNSTNLSRAARKLQQISRDRGTPLTYAQARQRLVDAGTIPDLDDHDAVTVLLNPIPLAQDLTDALFDVVIRDEIGYTADTFTYVDLPEEVRNLVADATGRVTWTDPSGGTWTVTPNDAGITSWYVESGTGERLSGRFSDEAAAQAEAARRGERLISVRVDADGVLLEDRLVYDYASQPSWVCDECSNVIHADDAQSKDHALWCSLHPKNETRRPTIVRADENGDFVLSDGSLGNPGCDDCGMEDAAVKADGRFLCVSAAVEAGLIPEEPAATDPHQ